MRPQTNLSIALTSIIAAVVAMGLGRFGLTPQIPHMLAEGHINVTQASLLAAANFLGYLLGSIEVTRAHNKHLILRLQSGLWGSAAILILSAPLAQDFTLNLTLRFLAGIASAWSLILITTWLQHQLARDHALRTLAYTGPGVGIIVCGLLGLAFDYWNTNSSFNWLIFGIVGFLGIASAAPNLPTALPAVSTHERFPMTRSIRIMFITYVLCGVGYVLPATFLSKLAVDQFPHSILASAFWPIFGLAVVLGMLVLGLQKRIAAPQYWLAGIFTMQALGNLACTFLPGIGGLLIGALFVGSSFMMILQLMMQLGSQLAPNHLRTVTGFLTVGFSIGQLVGPLLSAASTHYWGTMTPALVLAACGSFTAAILILSVRR